MAVIRGSFILTLFMLLTLPLMPVQALLIATGTPLRRTLPRWYHGGVSRLLVVRVHLSGEPGPCGAPSLYPRLLAPPRRSFLVASLFLHRQAGGGGLALRVLAGQVAADHLHRPQPARLGEGDDRRGGGAPRRRGPNGAVRRRHI